MAKKEKEIWKHIAGLSLGCEVSSYGNVRVNYGDHMKEVPLHTSYKGDTIVYLEGKQLIVHRLVAEAFLPQIEAPAVVKHLDGDKSNNAVTNLKWSSYSDEARSHVHTGKLRGTRVLCKETGKVYATIQSAAFCTGLQICAVEYGLQNGCIMFGYTFLHVEDEQNIDDMILVTTQQIIELGKKLNSTDQIEEG